MKMPPPIATKFTKLVLTILAITILGIILSFISQDHTLLMLSAGVAVAGGVKIIDYPEINVSSELNTPGSVLSYYKKMILLRKNLDYANTFTYGEFIPFHPDIHNLMAYYRSGDKDILIIANYQKDARTIMLSREPKQILLNNYDKFSLSNLELNLLGYQALVLEL